MPGGLLCARRLLAPLLLSGAALTLTTGCRHHQRMAAAPTLPPPLVQGNYEPPAPSDTPADAEFIRTHRPFYSEEGLASWYGPPYDKRRGANGEIYDENALTAAHRTLPLNSLIRVTNVATGRSAIMRVTDRGPFVHGRILDLSLASAKAVGVWRPGVALVRMEVYAAPAAIDRGGRWCVQVGAFKSGHQAIKLRDRLTREYQTARVIEFPGPTGYWVRIRPVRDDKGLASEIARSLRPSEGEAYLVRLD